VRITVKGIKENLKELSNKTIAEQSQRFFKTGKGEYGEGDRFLGIRVPALRRLVKKYSDVSTNETLILLKSSFHEERLFALLMLVEMFSKRDEGGKTEIYELYLGNTEFINNWDLVDGSAEHIVGAYLKNRDKQPLYDLAGSENLWERRISIMSTFHFIKNNEFTDALKISEILRCDNEDLIHKAVGWMLREIGKRNLTVEENFLKKHYKNMPRTMLRYSIEKFPEEKRLAYLTDTIYTQRHK
jgi:3-methyladenine DNA glycosylase AlkD